MVRRIVGVLAAVGRGEIKPRDAGRFLESDRPGPGGKTAAAMAAPAAGLFLGLSATRATRQPDQWAGC